MGKLDGKLAVVTGGGSGIGRAAAIKLAAEGATVVVTGRRLSPLEGTVAEIQRKHGQAFAMTLDLEDDASIQAFVAEVQRTRGSVDILVNNAGHSSKVRSIAYVGLEEWDSVVKVNLTGVYRLCQAVIPGMLDRSSGTIITVSSMSALRPGLLGGAPYSAAKAGVLNLMGDINAEFGDGGIRATTILPAEVDTPILNNRPLPPDETARATMMGPDDVADAILLCATLPHRTVIEQVVMSPTKKRDVSADIEAARRAGASS